jgi:hypothetical protein
VAKCLVYLPHSRMGSDCQHPDEAKRAEFVEAVFLKLHEVVVAIELSAAVTACTDVFSAARDGRADPWKYGGVQGSA